VTFLEPGFVDVPCSPVWDSMRIRSSGFVAVFLFWYGYVLLLLIVLCVSMYIVFVVLSIIIVSMMFSLEERESEYKHTKT